MGMTGALHTLECVITCMCAVRVCAGALVLVGLDMVLIYLVKHLLTHKANVNDPDKGTAEHVDATPLWRKVMVSLVNPRLNIFPSAVLLAIVAWSPCSTLM